MSTDALNSLLQDHAPALVFWNVLFEQGKADPVIVDLRVIANRVREGHRSIPGARAMDLSEVAGTSHNSPRIAAIASRSCTSQSGLGLAKL